MQKVELCDPLLGAGRNIPDGSVGTLVDSPVCAHSGRPTNQPTNQPTGQLDPSLSIDIAARSSVLRIFISVKDLGSMGQDGISPWCSG